MIRTPITEINKFQRVIDENAFPILPKDAIKSVQILNRGTSMVMIDGIIPLPPYKEFTFKADEYAVLKMNITFKFGETVSDCSPELMNGNNLIFITTINKSLCQ